MSSGTIQLIQITPDELREAIVSGVRAEVDKLKADFQPKQPTEFMTRNEVRDLLNVDLSTVHNWTKRGKLKAYGLGGRLYYKRAEVEEAIKPLRP
ncbi:MAG TPA: helix-turn-helix domain-containing protein [Prolixibacteraceae bacterium]|jgi:excisionase family DNA binding protein|nr:helix-turn-helix domain-containing protein [Prolixibacteraceae bacterium]